MFGSCLGVLLLVQTALVFLFFQSCITVRGLQGAALLAVLLLTDAAEVMLSRDTDATDAAESETELQLRASSSPAEKDSNSEENGEEELTNDVEKETEVKKDTTSQQHEDMVQLSSASPRLALAVFLTFSAVLLSVAAFAAPVAPKAAREIETASVISFWTWNVQRGFSLDGELNMERVAQLAVSQGADVVAMQESEASSPITGGRDVPGYIGAAMGARYEVVYGAGGDPLSASFDGTAVVSRSPIIKSTSHRLWTYGVFPTFTLTECVLAVGAREVHVLNVHPTLVPKDIQAAAIAFLVQRALEALRVGGGEHTNSSTAAVLIAGDFNVEAESEALDGLYALGFRHALNPERHPDFVYPVTRDASGSRVDHIFFSPSTLEVVAGEAEDAQAGVVAASKGLSDHSAVRQQFRLVDVDVSSEAA